MGLNWTTKWKISSCWSIIILFSIYGQGTYPLENFPPNKSVKEQLLLEILILQGFPIF